MWRRLCTQGAQPGKQMNHNRGGPRNPQHHQWTWLGIDGNDICIYRCEKCKRELRRKGFNMQWKNAFVLDGVRYPYRTPMPRCEVAQ